VERQKPADLQTTELSQLAEQVHCPDETQRTLCHWHGAWQKVLTEQDITVISTIYFFFTSDSVNIRSVHPSAEMAPDIIIDLEKVEGQAIMHKSVGYNISSK